MDNKNTFGAIFLGVILLLFIGGGYFLMQYMTKDSDISLASNDNSESKVDLRVDKSKDYLYFENGIEFLEEEEIEKQDAVFNFASLDELNKKLHQELEALYANVVKVSDANIPDGTEYKKNEKGYYSFGFREYLDTEFDNYVSLVVLDYNYDAINGSVIDKLKSYVVDKNTGELVDAATLLARFNINEDNLYASITKRLDDTQVLDGDEVIIDKDGTINALKASNYNDGLKALSISKNGKLAVNFIVKSNKINYNDSIEIN